MASITYQFPWGFATYDVDTEQDSIAQIEQEGGFTGKFTLTDDQRNIVDDSETELLVENGDLILYPSENYTPPEKEAPIPDGAIQIAGSE